MALNKIPSTMISGLTNGTNFITNPDAESGTTGWTVDSFAAATRPSGALTGVTTGLTFSTTSTTPLAGANSFTLTKDAANRQGRVVYTGLTITPAYQAKVLQVSMDYIVNSGTFTAGSTSVDSSLIVYLWDITNNTFIEPSSFKFLSNSTTIADKFQTTFQTSATGTSYRLLLFVSDSSSNSWSLKLDNISVNPSNYVFGTPITDWQSFTMTIAGATTNPTKSGSITRDKARWRRVGDSMEIVYQFYQSGAGTAGSGIYKFLLPSGHSIDSTKIDAIADGNQCHVGSANTYVNGSLSKTGWVVAFDATSLALQVGNEAYTPTMVGSSFDSLANGPALYNFSARVPILGWSSSVQMSDSADTRVVSFQAYKTSNSAAFTAGVDTIITFPSVGKDSHGAFNATFDTYTVQVPGDYQVAANAYWNTGASATTTQVKIYIDGALYMIPSIAPCLANNISMNNFSVILPSLKTGQTIKIYGWVNGGTTTIISSDANKLTSLSISRLSGPSAIAANESITASYSTDAGTGQTLTSGVETTIFFGTKIDDSHGIYNPATGEVTIQASGVYFIESQISWNGSASGGNGRYFGLRKGDGTVLRFEFQVAPAAYSIASAVMWQGRLNAGEKVLVKATHTAGGTLSLSTDSTYNQFSIRRVGN